MVWIGKRGRDARASLVFFSRNGVGRDHHKVFFLLLHSLLLNHHQHHILIFTRHCLATSVNTRTHVHTTPRRSALSRTISRRSAYSQPRIRFEPAQLGVAAWEQGLKTRGCKKEDRESSCTCEWQKSFCSAATLLTLPVAQHCRRRRCSGDDPRHHVHLASRCRSASRQ